MEILHEISPIDMKFEKTTWQKKLFRFHWHENFEIIIPLDNPFGVLIDGVSYEVKPGDVIIINQHAVHSFRIDRDNTHVFLGQFPYRILLNIGIIPADIKPIISSEEINQDKIFSNQLKSIFNILANEETVIKNEQNPFLQCTYSALYFLLMRKFSLPPKSRNDQKEKQIFCEIVNYANEHFSKNITIQSISRSLYMDRSRVSKIFSKYAGMSLNHYINSLRAKMAAELIEKGETKTYAALESGFQSIKTFNKFYKK